MKKVILLCGMLLAISATVASAAQGVNLRWGACFGDGGQINRTFACNTNTQNHPMVGGFELGADMLSVSGNEIVIDLASSSPAFPEWWQFRNAGSCRQTSLSFNTTISPIALNCVDWANGLSVGGIGAYILNVAGPNTARIVAAAAVPPDALASLLGGQEYFSFSLVMNSAKTLGSPSCAGCDVPVCLSFNSLNLTTPVAANNRKLTGPTNLGLDSNYAMWQGGGNPGTPRGTGCPGATPTRSTTWGSVKSLYR